MLLSDQLSEYISACFTGLWVQSHEHDDALTEIAQLCQRESWRLASWDVAQGLQIPGQNGEADAGGSDPLAADTFGAEGQYLSAGKKLLDTRHPAFKEVTSVRSRMIALFKGMSLPYPEPGIRLIRQDRIDSFNVQMEELRDQLQEAVSRLDEHYGELQQAARQQLGSLFNEADYPPTLHGLFGVQWDFPSVEPPNYLQQLNPELYRQECQRVTARFDEAVQLAEQAFLEELQKLVEHLTERLSGNGDTRPKVFRDSAISNLTSFFERFQQLNLHSDEQLDQLVDQCQSIVRGVRPQSLRDNQGLRQTVAHELEQVQGVLDNLLVDRPRRNILRQPR